MIMHGIFITATDGYRLSALFGTANGKRVGQIIISSATGIRKEFYINFSTYLIQNGYDVLLYDYRGKGVQHLKIYVHQKRICMNGVQRI